MLVPPPVATQSSREGGWEGDYAPCRPAVDGRRDKDTQPCANDNTGHTGNTLQVVQHAFVICALSITFVLFRETERLLFFAKV